jgi:hypothetical protein
MEYKDFEFYVVQTANPPGWKWTVFLDETRTRTGRAPTRASAVVEAERLIDHFVKSSDNELS